MDGICKTLNISNIDDINTSFIANIISQDYKTYDKMKALGCLTHHLINKNKFPSPMSDKVLGEGSAGLAKLVNIFEGSNMVLKVNDKKIDSDNEYLVGAQLNVLRQYTPCFSYVFGQIDKKVIYEYGGEMSLHVWKHTYKDNVVDLLLIIIQVLVSIEIAQRKYRFIHNDLHGANIMLRNKRDSYTMILGDIEYKFNNVIVPCIIDYGMSYIEIGDIYRPEYNGIRRHLFVQGFDPYFLLADCAVNTIVGNIKATSLQLLNNFYKSTNPYNFSVTKNMDDNCSKIYDSMAATNTPFELVSFILHIGNISQITLNARNVYIEQKPSEKLINIYTNLLGINNYTLNPTNCNGGFKSLVISKYFKFEDEAIYEGLENDRHALSQALEYFNKEDPNELVSVCNTILYTRIPNHPKISPQHVDRLFEMVSYINMFNMLYYMCYELRNVLLLPLLPLLNRDNGKIKTHLGNSIIYNKATSWYMTLDKKY